jgi:hypothetical protein
MLEAAGGANVFADVDRESVQATTELILARAPEVIPEVCSADILTAEEAAREAASWLRSRRCPPSVKASDRPHRESGTVRRGRAWRTWCNRWRRHPTEATARCQRASCELSISTTRSRSDLGI